MLGEAEPGASPELGLQASGILSTAARGLGAIVPPVRPPPGTELLQGQAFLREGVGWGCSPPSPWEPLAPLLSTVPAPGPWAELAERRRAPLEKAAISQPAYKQDNSPCPRSPQESWEEESSVQPQRSAEDKQPRSAMRSPRLLRDARWGLPRRRAGSARG